MPEPAQADSTALEQAHVDALYARLDALRVQAGRRLESVQREGPSGSPQNRSERDAFAALHAGRLAQLDAVEDRLCFGRIDLADGGDRHIGRIGLTDARQTPILTDWRAPAAEAFYQATAAHPMGLTGRRHITTRGRQVVALEDEVLDLDAVDQAGASLSGEGALLVALAAERTGRMADIVATIQAEQDRIIRAAIPGPLVVHGGPGTGKTAVALHRAAYLLYTHRQRLASAGVLVVGPSRVFLTYIDRVLPSLGETGVVATTMAELIPGLTATGLDGPVAAEVKGRATMAAAIGRAVRNRQRLPARDGVVHVLGQELALRVVDVARAQEAARSANRPYNQARAVFTRHLIDLLTDRLMAALGGADTIAAERDELADDVRSSREVRIALNLCWMPMTPTGLIEELFANPVLLAAAAPDLSPAERAALTRPAGSPWTLGDVPLIDEAAELLGEDQTAARRQRRAAARAREQDIAFAAKVLSSHGGTYYTAEELADRWNSSGPKLTPAERAATDRTWVYGHIVVDEAQELSAMDWRTLLRRCPTRSMTIVGDTGQTHSAAGASNWAATLGPVLGPGGWREERLTINYRTPASIATEAQRVAQAAGVAVEPTLAARDEADAFAWVPAGRDPVAAAIETAAELAATGSGKMAVICPEASVAATRRAIEASALGTLTAAGWPDGPAGGAGAAALLDARLTVLDPRQAKGLEFDDVIVLGPEQIAAGGAGVRDLYVAMTRPTHRLRLVGSEPAWRPAPVDGSKRDSSLA